MDTAAAAPVDLTGFTRRWVKLLAPPYLHAHELVARTGPQIIEFEMKTFEKEMQIGDDTHLQAMKFNGSLPGLVILGHVGDYVELTLFNSPDNLMQHDIVVHAATGALGAGHWGRGIEAGDFRQGTRVVDVPLEALTVRAIEVLRFQVSQADLARQVADRVCRAWPSDRGADLAQTNVSFNDATAYAVWVSDQTGLLWCLPTDAEWPFSVAVHHAQRENRSSRCISHPTNCSALPLHLAAPPIRLRRRPRSIVLPCGG